jgi:hypothetical protein
VLLPSGRLQPRTIVVRIGPSKVYALPLGLAGRTKWLIFLALFFF